MHEASHAHHAGHEHGPERGAAFLGTAFWIAVLILAAEVAGGLLSHSLALLSDAGHMCTDVLALGLSWIAMRLSVRRATSVLTYGYQRAGILAALFNAVTLIAVSAAIVVEAIHRLAQPVAVTPWIMWVTAALGLFGNLYLGFGPGGGPGHAAHDLNVRGALLHVFGDAAASAGVLIAGVLIAVTGKFFWDPILSIGIALLIALGAWRLLRESVQVLMEAIPGDLDIARVQDCIAEDPEVLSCHHVHVWSLDGRHRMLSGHVAVGDRLLSDTRGFVARIGQRLEQEFRITHITLQLESDAPCDDADCE